MGVYISYYDCSGWQSEVEVINAQSRKAPYRLSVYDRSGGVLINEKRWLNAHQTERLKLNDLVAGQDGKIMILPVEDEDDEFPAMLTVADEGGDFRQANRFVPFFRVDEMEEYEEEEDDDEEDEEEADDEEEVEKAKASAE